MTSFTLHAVASLWPGFDRPLFVLSAPRSGSSHLFELIKRLSNVLTFEKEADFVWWRVFPYGRLPIPTDYVGSEECNEERAAQIKCLIAFNLLRRGRVGYFDALRRIIFRKPVRYAEKTIANCFHLDIISQIFPDALFVHLVRDARACVSSMIEGWSSPKFMERSVPLEKGSTIAYWKYPIPPNWQSVTGRPIAEICAWSWVEHNRFVLAKLQNDLKFAANYLRVTYEDLVERPTEIIQRTAQFADLHCTAECLDYLAQNQLSWTTVTSPKRDKWKERHFESINSIIPTVTPMMGQLGYALGKT